MTSPRRSWPVAALVQGTTATVFCHAASPAPAELRQLDVLYVVGGLYGNEFALARVREWSAEVLGNEAA